MRAASVLKSAEIQFVVSNFALDLNNKSQVLAISLRPKRHARPFYPVIRGAWVGNQGQ